MNRVCEVRVPITLDQPRTLIFNVCEVRVPITLDQPRTLIFNFNTVRAFEAASKSRYWAFVADLFALQSKILADATAKWQAEHPDEPLKLDQVRYNFVDIMRELSMESLQTLIWAACHEYGPNDKPVWPLTIDQLGRYITPMGTVEMFKSALQGLSTNNPTPRELGEASAPDGANANLPAGAMPETETIPANGGTPSTALPADAFV